MSKYLFKKLEQAHSAFIENLIFIPNEVIRPGISDAFEDFQGLEYETICETLDWRKEKSVYDIIESEIEGENLAGMIYQNKQTGFLAECYFPEFHNFKFKNADDKEPFIWSVSPGCCRIIWLYADCLAELIDKIVNKSNELFQEAVAAEINK